MRTLVHQATTMGSFLSHAPGQSLPPAAVEGKSSNVWNYAKVHMKLEPSAEELSDSNDSDEDSSDEVDADL